MTTSERRALPFVVVVALAAAFGAAAVVAVAVLWPGDDGTGDPASPEVTVDDSVASSLEGDQLADARAFIEAWTDYRLAMLRVDSQFVRENEAGDRLESEVVVVQRPPHRLVARLGGVVGIYEGEGVVCDSGLDRELRCTETGDVDYLDDVQRELVALASSFGGAAPAYEVRRVADGCFELVQVRFDVLGELGLSSEYCFDESTAALVSTVIDHGGVVETTSAVNVSTEVSRDDFEDLLGGG